MKPPLEPPKSVRTGTHQMPLADYAVRITTEDVVRARARTELQAKRLALIEWRRKNLTPKVEVVAPKGKSS